MNTEQNALSAYIAMIAQIATLAEAIAEYADDHGGIDPDNVTWATVGSATEVRNRLAEIADFIGLEIGEEE